MESPLTLIKLKSKTPNLLNNLFSPVIPSPLLIFSSHTGEFFFHVTHTFSFCLHPFNSFPSSLNKNTKSVLTYLALHKSLAYFLLQLIFEHFPFPYYISATVMVLSSIQNPTSELWHLLFSLIEIIMTWIFDTSPCPHHEQSTLFYL